MEMNEEPEQIDVAGRALVKVRIAYPWRIGRGKRDATAERGQKRRSALIKFAKACAHAATTAVTSQLGLRETAVSVDVERLRGSAGAFLSDVIFSRLSDTDVLIADITGHNPNVMLEVGAAIASKKTRVFLVKELPANAGVGHLAPSDLQGYYVTRIGRDEDGTIALNRDVSLRSGVTGAIASRLREGLRTAPAESSVHQNSDEIPWPARTAEPAPPAPRA